MMRLFKLKPPSVTYFFQQGYINDTINWGLSVQMPKTMGEHLIQTIKQCICKPPAGNFLCVCGTQTKTYKVLLPLNINNLLKTKTG